MALGDSMSDCDHYAATDAAERFGSVPSQPPYGSASLLWKNRDDLWPDFTGRDLSTLCPGATFHNLSGDGGTTGGFSATILRARLDAWVENLRL